MIESSRSRCFNQCSFFVCVCVLFDFCCVMFSVSNGLVNITLHICASMYLASWLRNKTSPSRPETLTGFFHCGKLSCLKQALPLDYNIFDKFYFYLKLVLILQMIQMQQMVFQLCVMLLYVVLHPLIELKLLKQVTGQYGKFRTLSKY